jgi:S-DNA-T family DNA segregation ATPase FtsK/SpoIIIE
VEGANVTQRLVHRPARVRPPERASGPLDIAAPPLPSESGGGVAGMMQVMLPVLGGGGSLVMILANRNALMLVAGGMMLAVTVLGGLVAFVGQRTGANRRASTARSRYLSYLGTIRSELADEAEHQRTNAVARHPEPSELLTLLADPTRLWQRRRADPDFLVVRVGVGTGSLFRSIQVAATANPMASPDSVAAAALERTRQAGVVVERMPVAIPVRGTVSVVGDGPASAALLRAFLVQLAALHAPDDVRVVLSLGPGARSEFEWTKWLPHLLDPGRFDGPVARRLVARDAGELATVLQDEITRRRLQIAQQRRTGSPHAPVPTPQLVVIRDQRGRPGADPMELIGPEVTPQELGISVLTIVARREDEPGHVDVRVTLAGSQVAVDDLRTGPDDVARGRLVVAGATRGRLDRVDPAAATAVARRLAPLRLVEDAALEAPLESTIELSGLVGVDDVGDYDVASRWSARPAEDFLRVPFGLGATGQQVSLDFKESAQNGMGPHGLCVGATGSGKSEVLRTLVLTLAMTHPPERVSLVLVDYKGGATFAGLEGLPHVAAMVSNLSDDTGLVDRLHDALRGEINRRQQLLLDAGSLANTTEYNARRDAGQDLDALPNLLVVIDEFGEMLSAKPDFIELFLQIGRIGRSIGIHLLLASQRLEEGRLRGLESCLSYRIGLRTFNAQESRTVLGVPDAYELPPIAGSGYLKVDTTVFERFKAAYVSGPYRPTIDAAPTELPARPMPYPLLNETARWLARGERQPRHAHREDAAPQFAPTTLAIVVDRLREVAPQVQQIWLPPLPAAVPLNAVLGDLGSDLGRGLNARTHQHLRIPVGLLDKPAEQWQGPLELDLAGGAGNLAVMGAPQTGKSSTLRTLIAAAALTHTPGEITFYGLDLGGGGLTAVQALPHVGGIAGRLDPDRVRRTVAEVAAHLAEREQLFTHHRLDSVEAMRAAHRAGRFPAAPDIFLVIDNWTVFKDDFEDLTDVVQEIAARGLGYGIHLVISTGRWADLRLPMQAVIGTKIELRLNDPLDSCLDRKAVENLRADTPGRVVVAGGLIGQIALPRLDNDPDPATAPAGLDDLVKAVATAWTGPPAPEIRMLPAVVRRQALREQHPNSGPVLLGIEEDELRPVRLDLLGADQHLLVFGDGESGKTGLARLIVRDLVERYSDDEVVFAVFDPRRTLLDVVPEPYLGSYAGTAATAAGMASGIGAELTKRLPPDDVTAAQLRARSWWAGPEIVIIVDDYDLLAPTGPGPLLPLLEFLPQSRDLGLHLVLLRRSGGAGRAMHEPVPQRMRELGATGLLLSGERAEGQLWPGAYPSVQPPGRGLLVRRGRPPVRIQVCYEPEQPLGSGGPVPGRPT